MFFLLVFPSSTSGVVGVCLFLWASSRLIKNETKTWSGPRNNGLFWQVEPEDLIGFKSVGVGQLFWPNMGWNGAACNKIVKAEASQKSRDLFFSVVCQPHRQCKILVFLKRSLCCFHCCVPNFTERLCFSSSFVCWQAPFHAVRLRSKRWWVSFEEPVVQLSRFLLKLFRFRSLCRGLCWVLCQKILSKISRSSGPRATCTRSRSLQNDHLCASGLHSLPPTCSLGLRSRKPCNTIEEGVANEPARRCGSQICSPVKSRLYLWTLSGLIYNVHSFSVI